MKMAEHIEEVDTEEKFEPGKYLRVLQRRHVLFVAVVGAVWLALWGASWLMTPKYKSGTLILVEQPTLPTNYVTPNVTDNLQDRLQTITQQILSRTRLLHIIHKLHLYEGASRSMTDDQKVIAMRKDISVKVEDDSRTGAITAFHVFYTAPSPELAQKVTGELTNLFINENLRVRQRQSEETTQFLRDQLTTAQAQLAAQDAKVRIFRSAHPGALPSQEASNLQILSGLQSQLLSDENALTTAQQEQVYAQSLLNGYQGESGSIAQNPQKSSALTIMDDRLATLKDKLATLRTRYTDQYPDVQAVKAEIAKTEALRKELMLSSAKQSAGGKAASQTAANEPGAAGMTAPILQLKSQLQASRADVANRERSIANLKERIKEYQDRLNQEPAVEQQLADLTRGYQQSQTNYDNLLKKVQESQMATSMEQMQEGQRFKVLDPPSLPLRPSSPPRLKMSALGIIGGIAFGCLAVFGAEFLDDRLYTGEEIEKLLNVPVISELPEIETTVDAGRRRKSTLLRWGMTGVVVITIIVGTAVSYLHP
jgi:polysaccharide chain length determinant protein (PEP-CTERM system associated)